MSLRGRLLVLMVLMNLLVLGGIHITAVIVQDRWLARETQAHLDILQRDYGYLLPSGASIEENERASIDTMRRILDREDFAFKFRDIMISGADRFGNLVDVNPLGAAHRLHDSFPLDAIRAGIQEAKREQRLVNVAGGRCVAISTGDGAAEGGAWFVPALPSEPRLSFVAYAIPVLLSIIVFAILAGWIVNRTLGQPMDHLGAAARRVESGDYSARVPGLKSAPELKTLVDAFNAMAVKVEGHTAELQSEVQRATEEAAAKERALLVSSRLASMGTLAAGVAHEINNPIGGMLNAVHSLSKSSGLSEKESRYLELVRQGLTRVARTSRKLLDFTPRVIEPVLFQLREAVDGAYSLVEHEIARQDVAYEIDLPPDLPRLSGEPHEIQQVLLNLFLNSLNAMRGAAACRLSVSARHRDGDIEITVADDGPGVDAETLDRVMDPFFSSSSAPDSTGLGLFICYTIIRNHGGDMRVESVAGEGFTVWMRLPCIPPPPAGGRRG